MLSPITESSTGTGHDYADSVIYAFAHTNKDHWNRYHLPILPVLGAANANGDYFSYSRTGKSGKPVTWPCCASGMRVVGRWSRRLSCPS